MADPIISEPAFREETVIDIDVSYPSGKCEFTLRGEDRFDDSKPEYATIHLTEKVSPAPSPAEDIVLFKGQMEYYSIRRRVIKWPVKKPIVAPVDTPSENPASES